jgi:hypothetical protein
LALHGGFVDLYFRVVGVRPLARRKSSNRNRAIPSKLQHGSLRKFCSLSCWTGKGNFSNG